MNELNIRSARVANDMEETREGLDIRALLRFFMRRWWLMISVGTLVAICVSAMTMLQPAKFTAYASIMISPQNGDIVSNESAVSDVNPDVGAIESQMEVLTSRKLIGELVDRLKLTQDPNWNGALQSKGPLASLFGGAETTKKTRKVSSQEREAVIDHVASNVRANRKGLTYVIEVWATSRDPKQSAQMANQIIALYFESQLQMRFAAGEKAYSWLADRLTGLKREVQQKEAAVEAYRAETGLLTAEGASLTEQQITGLQGSVIAARTDLAEREARYAQVQTLIRAGGSIDSIAGVINSGTIQTLRAQEAQLARTQADLEARYGELHPAIAKARVEREGIEQQIRAETARISANLKNEVEVARARLNTLLGNQQAVQGQLVTNNSGMVKLRELERDASATRTIYESFLRRYQELSESQSLKVTDAHLVSEAAVPTGKSSPKLSLALLLGFALGGMLGGAAGLIVDLMDEGLDSAASVERETGKQVLASVPVVKPENLKAQPIQNFDELLREATKASGLKELRRVFGQAVKLVFSGRLGAAFGKKAQLDVDESPTFHHPEDVMPEWHPADHLVDKPMSAFAEGFRSLRASLLFSGLERRVKVVAVTSAMPGEGKTTTSVCLARVAGLSGQKVIVIDCDLRRRSLNGVLKLTPEQGLLQVLMGEVPWANVIVEDKSTGIHVLPACEASFTPFDVFGSNAMRALVAELTEKYDLVILDCPPVLAVAETRIVCRLADETVLVVRWAQTPARAAVGAIEQIESCGGSVVGVAINCVDPNAPGRGSYGDITYQARYAGEYYAS